MATPESVLICDDEAHVRLYLKIILRKIGLEEFYEASDGAMGVKIYKENQPELVLMDVNMPKVDGIEALKQIIAFDPEAVVIMMTSQASRKVIEESQILGASQYIRKDTSKEDIEKLLRETFENIWED